MTISTKKNQKLTGRDKRSLNFTEYVANISYVGQTILDIHDCIWLVCAAHYR